MSSKETAEAILMVIKRLFKWLFFILLATLLVFLAIYAYTKIEEHYKNRPKFVAELKGVHLGEKFQDFMFRNAGFVIDTARKKTNDVIYYGNNEKSLTVAISDNKVVRVIYGCMDKLEYTSINGIECRSSGDSILSKYDSKVRVQCIKDRSNSDYLIYRVYDAVGFGIRYHVVSNEVMAFDIAAQGELTKLDGFMNTNWTSCE